MNKTNKYFDRDLSWLTFNYRVLLEARDPELPLYERIKFLGIYSNNLDEFFRVRVASLRSLKKLKKVNRKEYLDFKPKKLLSKIHEVVNQQQNEFGEIFRESILPELKKNKIILYQEATKEEQHFNEIRKFFRSKVLSYLQPVFIKNKDSLFLDNGKLYFIVKLKKKKAPGKEDQVQYAHLNIPSDKLPRFKKLSVIDQCHYYIFLDDVISMNLNFMFPGYEILNCYSIKLNRDADLQIEDEYSGDLVEKIESHLAQRQKGLPARFLYDNKMPEDFVHFLKDKFKLRKNDLVPGGRYHNLFDLMNFPNPLSPALKVKPWPPLNKKDLDTYESLFEAIEKKDRILHFPYQSYDYVLRFFNEAAIDPAVHEIRITMYRIAPDSFIANALISAAKNGKKVTVFVEVKARFDEANNLHWAHQMEEAGIRIIYSIPGLKVHAKVALVKRGSGDGQLKNYAYFGTGNFNETTARIYADHGLFTCHKEMSDELDQVFQYLSDNKPLSNLRHLLVSKFNLQQHFLQLIDREIMHAKEGKEARIFIKLNNIQDEVMIDKLYEASRAGVKVDMIIRAICCIVPGVKGQSENIRLYRIVDRYLEHARVLIFHNDGHDEMYLGSADWMKRNLYKRIEVMYQVYDKEIKAEIDQIIKLQLEDDTSSRKLDQHLNHCKIADKTYSTRAQRDTYQWLKEKEDLQANTRPAEYST